MRVDRLALALVLTATACIDYGLESRAFLCTTDGDCGAGWTCGPGGTCVRAGAGADAGPIDGAADGAVGDAAAGDGGGHEVCGDGVDDDGDGLVDCRDPDCGAASCDDVNPCTVDFCQVNGVCRSEAAPGGTTCGDGCSCEGGVATENDCANGEDDDGDGPRDCLDPDCGAASCDDGDACSLDTCGVTGDCGHAPLTGTSCGSGCVCQVGVKTESACTDGSDNDSDGAIDCADLDCGAAVCIDTNPCTLDACQPDGACTHEAETGASCGAGCACLSGVATETACGDGADNDGDSAKDCQDADCPACVGGTTCCDTGVCSAVCM